jgi:hypothetical protein
LSRPTTNDQKIIIFNITTQESIFLKDTTATFEEILPEKFGTKKTGTCYGTVPFCLGSGSGSGFPPPKKKNNGSGSGSVYGSYQQGTPNPLKS